MPAASGAPSPGPASSQLPVSADVESAPPILDAFGNPLELPGHIAPLQIFELLDQALPFEVCLYHRVLPLSIHQNQLHLGMVDPHDEQALDYIGRIAAYSDRTLTPIPLAGHLHQVLLSAYLHHRSQPATSVTQVDAAAKLSDPPGKRHPIAEALRDETMPDEEPCSASRLPAPVPDPVHQSLEEWELETLFPSSATIPPSLSQDSSTASQDLGMAEPKRSTSTLSIEQPSHLETLLTTEVKAKAITERRQEPSPAINQRMTLVLDETEIMAELAQVSQSADTVNRLELPTLVDGVSKDLRSHQDGEQKHAGLSRDLVEDAPCLNENPILPKRLESLVEGELSQRDWSGIAHLPPNLILQAMLGRMLKGNITRLRIERYRRPQINGELAQLLWNPAGVLQPAWSGFSLGAFAALTKALRELAQLPLGTIQQPIQRGTMRRYQGQPLLLLMQFLPGAKVAAIELRLLQGQALQEFQQHQGAGLGREALLTAQILQHQVQQLFDHNQRYPESSTVPEQLMTVIGYLEKMIAGQTTTDSSVKDPKD